MLYFWLILIGAIAFAVLGLYYPTIILLDARKSLLKLRDKVNWGNSWEHGPRSNLSNIIYGLNLGGSYDFENPLNTRLQPWIIGSTAEELIALRREGFLFETKRALEIFRNHSGYCEPKLIKYDLKQIGMRLEDIGTNEEELERLHEEQFRMSLGWPEWRPLPENWKNM